MNPLPTIYPKNDTIAPFSTATVREIAKNRSGFKAFSPPKYIKPGIEIGPECLMTKAAIYGFE